MNIFRMICACIVLSACTNNESSQSPIVDKTLVSHRISKASKSFVFIETAVEFTSICSDEQSECTETSETLHSAMGSGMTIKRKGTIYVLTAGHVCQPQHYDPYLSSLSGIGTITNHLKGHGYFGNQSEFEILGVNIPKDICILKSKNKWVSPPAKLAKKLPKQGSPLYMVAAPLGIFEPGVVLGFDGYYAGLDSEGDILVSMPTRPGTSGAAILNKENEIVGIIHSAISRIENVGIGTPITAVHELFETIKK